MSASTAGGTAGTSLARSPALAKLSLEQLSGIVVTSVSRRSERWADAAASVFVITAEDIRRSGATTLPEVLRLAPNLLVARADANQYAISVRGFNNVLANKLLVQIDGRTVYTPLFSGVFWEAQQAMLEDIERIEVVSGPGGTLWGANAVNGVINVITRSASETRGSLIALVAGERERTAAGRHGGRAGGIDYRFYARGFERENTERADGTAIRDSADGVQAGFRADWQDGVDSLVVQGDIYTAEIDQVPAARDIEGSNVVVRWTRENADGSSVRLQAYQDRTRRNHPGTFRQKLDTVDLDFQHALAPRDGHRILWGASYRHSRDRVDNSAALAFLPPHRTLEWGGVFVQDEYAIAADLDLIVGAKLESNSYTDVEFLPNARLAWRLARDHLLWGALSRAVRAPSRIDRDFFTPGVPPYAIAGGLRFESEVSTVAEVGFRAQPTPSLSYSITAFHHRHDRLRSLEPSDTGAGFVVGNGLEGSTAGIEAWGSWRLGPALRLTGGWLELRQDFDVRPGNAAAGGAAALGNDPRRQVMLRASLDLTPQHELDVQVRHVAALPDPVVPRYTAVDLRLGWKPSATLELALVARNLLDGHHPEWGVAANRAELERLLYLELRWRL